MYFNKGARLGAQINQFEQVVLAGDFSVQVFYRYLEALDLVGQRSTDLESSTICNVVNVLGALEAGDSQTGLGRLLCLHLRLWRY